MKQPYRTASWLVIGAVFTTSCSHISAPGTDAVALPAMALEAWENHARGLCAEVQTPFSPVHFTSLDALKNREEDFYTTLSSGDGALLSGNFNGDGQKDYIAATPEHGCPPAGLPYGRNGSQNDFILSTPTGYAVQHGFIGWLYRASIRRVDDRDMVEFARPYEGVCGDVAVTLLGLDSGLFSVAKYRNRAGQRVSGQGCPLP